MLPRGHRLRKTRDFERVFSSRSAVSGRFIRAVYLKTTLPISRLAVTVSTKVSKKAVVRNKIRRRVRATLKEYVPLPPSLDIVIIALKTAATADRQEFKADIKQVLEKIL